MADEPLAKPEDAPEIKDKPELNEPPEKPDLMEEPEGKAAADADDDDEVVWASDPGVGETVYGLAGYEGEVVVGAKEEYEEEQQDEEEADDAVARHSRCCERR